MYIFWGFVGQGFYGAVMRKIFEFVCQVATMLVIYYRPFAARDRRSRIAIAKPLPVGCATTTVDKDFSSAARSAAYRSRAKSVVVNGEAKRITSGGVGISASAIKPWPDVGV